MTKFLRVMSITALLAFLSCAIQLASPLTNQESRKRVQNNNKQGVLVVSYTADGQVALIDPASKKEFARFPSPQGPHEITISSDGSRAFIANSGTGPRGSPGDSVVVLDLNSRLVTSTFKPCDRPHDTRVSKDGKLLWVACSPMKAVLEIDAETGAIRNTWNTGIDGGWFVEVTPDERKLYVPHLEGKAFSVIDRRTGNVREVFKGTTQLGVSISPNGREVWVSDAEENRLSVVTTSNDRVSTTISLGPVVKGTPSFSRLRFTPDGRNVAVVRDSKFMLVDAKRHSVMWSTDMPHAGKVITVSDDSRRAFVSHPENDSISEINLLTKRVEATFAVGKQPDGVAWLKK
ncbi:MAG TPA: YncE family protein [Pyrinomonadaceae bacterium]|nr:YncE family protein [Pyrinomonadaceae bacterium]